MSAHDDELDDHPEYIEEMVQEALGHGDDFCSFEKPTGDKRWPVLCDRDNQFASRDECDDCREEMRRRRMLVRERR